MPNFKEENIENMLIAASQKIGWTYIESSSIPRTTDSVLLETWLKDALIRINRITESQAEFVIQRLRTRIVAGNNPDALIANNDDFRKLLFEKNSFPIGTGEDPNINI